MKPRKEAVIKQLVEDDIDTIRNSADDGYLFDILYERYTAQSYEELTQELHERKEA